MQITNSNSLLFLRFSEDYLLLYGQVLSRQKQLDEATYNRLLEHARQEGYDVGRLHKNTQNNDPETEAQKDKGFWWIKALLGK